MNCTAYLARVARKIKAAWMRQDGSSGGAVGRSWRRILRRLRFLRWALAVQMLKGAAYRRRCHRDPDHRGAVLHPLTPPRRPTSWLQDPMSRCCVSGPYGIRRHPVMWLRAPPAFDLRKRYRTACAGSVCHEAAGPCNA